MKNSERIEISRDVDGARVRIRMRKSVVRILFLVVWLPLITLGGSAVTTSLIIGALPRTIIQAVVQLLWIFVVIFGLRALLWNLFGEEVVVLEKGAFTHRRQILGLGLTRSVALRELTSLRVASDSKKDFWGVSGGTLVLNNGATEHRFGIELSQNEATGLVDQLVTYFPQNI